jgi:hypothetical protein
VNPSIKKVLAKKSTHCFVSGDCFSILRGMEPGSVDLIFGSPPYEDARLYGELGFDLVGERWVSWMVQFFKAAVPVTRGLVALVVGHGKTKGYKWSSTPSLLEADLHRSGFHLRAPGMFARAGIFGSGGPDYFRHDYEWIVTVQNTAFASPEGRGGPRLPWSNNVAVGHPPIYGPGGEASYRTSSGRRVNQWGGSSPGGDGERRQNGEKQKKVRPSHVVETQGGKKRGYKPPAIANPGNVAGEMLDGVEGSLLASGSVGGGHMGHPAAHENEAPFPMWLAERYVLSFCPPGGVVLDPFSGSGTTVHVAVENRRRGIGLDLRPDQVEVGKKRLLGVSQKLFVESDDEHQRRMEAKGGPVAPQGDDHVPREKARRRPRVAGHTVGDPA